MAIACGLAGSIWGITAQAVAVMLGLSSPIYSIFMLIGWALLPFYIKLIRRAFIVGIYLTAITMCYLFVTPSLSGTAAWYTLSRGLYDFTYVIAYLNGFGHIYFSYKSWKELLKK